MDTRLAVVIAVTIVTAFCGAVVALSSTTPLRKKLPFILTMAGVILWITTLYLSNVRQSSDDVALFLNRVVHIGPLLALVSFADVVSYIANNHQKVAAARFSTQTLRILMRGTGICAAIIALSPAGVASVSERISDDGLFTGYNINPGPLYILLAAMIALIGLVAIVHFIVIVSKAPKDSKKALKVVLFGLAITFSMGTITNLILPILTGGDDLLNTLGTLSPLFIIFALTYAMLWHNILDVKAAVARTATYLVTVGLLALLYVGPMVYLIIAYIYKATIDPVNFMLTVLVVTIAIASFGKIRQWFDQWSSKVFFRDRYDSAKVLGDLNTLLVSAPNLDQLTRESADLFAGVFKTGYVAIVLRETEHMPQNMILNSQPSSKRKIDISRLDSINNYYKEKILFVETIKDNDDTQSNYLKDLNAGVLIKLNSETFKNEPEIGYMILGYKKSGDGYNLQDYTTLQSMADVLVIAIQNALHYEEIQKFNMTLQRRVEEATAQLRRTNAKLKTLDETKDDFISMASHQLRTPLTSVKGYLSMVLEGDAGKLTDMQRKMLDQAFVSSQRMVFLISDLLNISRLKTGKFVIDPAKINLATMVTEEVRQLQETAKTRSLELVFDKPDDFPDLMLDETKTRQVIMNFIDNAIYYTPAGGRIEIALADRPDAIELRVSDNGIGVPKSEQQHLFTKFYRAGNARRTRPDGTGLGLFMAKKVIIAQGGAIIFDSKEGKGSTFGFALSKTKVLPK